MVALHSDKQFTNRNQATLTLGQCSPHCRIARIVIIVLELHTPLWEKRFYFLCLHSACYNGPQVSKVKNNLKL